MKLKMVRVEWLDAGELLPEGQSWMEHEEAKKMAEKYKISCINIGFLVEKNKDYILLAGTVGADHGQGQATYGMLFKIPAGCVKSITEVTP